MPERDIGIREQAIHDLAQPHPSPVLRNKIQDGKAAKSIRWGDKMPAGHCLPRELEQVVKPLGTTTRQDRFGLCPFDDRFDLRGECANFAELDTDLRQAGGQEAPSYQISGQAYFLLREAECWNPQPV